MKDKSCETKYIEIDIEKKSESCYSIMNNLQRVSLEKPHLCDLSGLFSGSVLNI